MNLNFSGVLFGRNTVERKKRDTLWPVSVDAQRDKALEQRAKTAPKAEKRGGYAPLEEEWEKTIRNEKLFFALDRWRRSHVGGEEE